jgi:hypothetical protein
MKKKLLFNLTLFFVFATVGLFAQIPNNGFENWKTVGNCMKPEGWYGTNDFADTTGTYFGITRSTDHYPTSVGSYSIRIESKPALLPAMAAYGICWAGNVNGSDKPSFPVTGHPTSFCGYYKFLPQNNDTMRIFLCLYKNGDEVQQAKIETTVAASVWTSFNVTIPSYTDADSARIMMAAFYPDGAFLPKGNSVLYVDNLSFNNLITGISDINEKTNISVDPNPANENLVITLPDNTGKQIDMQIFNVNGQQVLSQLIFDNTSTIDISKLTQGIYFVHATTEEGALYTKKIIIIK